MSGHFFIVFVLLAISTAGLGYRFRAFNEFGWKTARQLLRHASLP